MVFQDHLPWLRQSESRTTILTRLHQPSTASQLARTTDFSRDHCSRALCDLTQRTLTRCLNPRSRRSRLFWLTRTGHECQSSLRSSLDLSPLIHDFESVDWPLYGWALFNHREAIIKALSGLMTVQEIRRRAISQSPSLRISANNIRDILRLLETRGIVHKHASVTHSPARFELTDLGRKVYRLLWRAGVRA
jgi:hypothetical protein